MKLLLRSNLRLVAWHRSRLGRGCLSAVLLHRAGFMSCLRLIHHRSELGNRPALDCSYDWLGGNWPFGRGDRRHTTGYVRSGSVNGPTSGVGSPRFQQRFLPVKGDCRRSPAGLLVRASWTAQWGCIVLVSFIPNQAVCRSIPSQDACNCQWPVDANNNRQWAY